MIMQDVAFRLARLKIRHDAVAALIGELAGRLDDGVVDTVLVAGALTMPARRAFSAPAWRNCGFVLLRFDHAQFGALPRHSRLRDAAPATFYAEAGVC